MQIGKWSITYGARQVNGMQAFYVNALLRSLVFSMIGIFTPVYVYFEMLAELNSSMYAIASVGAFYLLVRFIVLIVSVPVARVIEKIGFRRSVIVSSIILVGYLGAMVVADHSYYWFLLATALSGLSIPLYWIARKSVIALDISRETLGQQMGNLAILERVAAILGPLTAGVIIERFGFPVMYAIAALILTVSVLPLLQMPHHVHRNGVSIAGFVAWIKSRRFFHQAAAAVGMTIDDHAGSLLWPLAIVLLGVQFGELGTLFSVLTVISIVVRYLSGALFDKLYSKHDLKDEVVFGVAAAGAAFAWVARIFVVSPVGVLAVDGGTMILATTHRAISGNYELLGGRRMHEIAYFTYIEMTNSVAVIGFTAIWIIGALLGVWKELLFLTVSFWLLVSIVQARESNMKR